MSVYPPERPLHPCILFVDDDRYVLESMRRVLCQALDESWEILFAADGGQALEMLAARSVHVMVTDIAMPMMDGRELVEILKRDHPQIVIVVLSGYWNQSQAFGHLGPKVRFLSKPVGEKLLAWTIKNAVAEYQENSSLAGTGAPAMSDGAAMADSVDLARRSQRMMMKAMAKLAEYRDGETGGHLLRVARMTHEIARTLHQDGVEPERCDLSFIQHVGVASILHDVGKVALPDSILLKSTTLTDKERRVMQQHTELGSAFLDNTRHLFDSSPYFRLAREIAGNHHEWWNGEGYPDRLAGKDIPLAARIVAVADVYDALSSERPYKNAWADEDVLCYMRKRRGIQFDPVIINSFLKVLSMRAEAPTVAWNDDIAIGHPTIDREHRKLLDLVNQLSIKENMVDPIIVEFAMEELIEYIHQHFSDEERILQEVEYPGLNRHRSLHVNISENVKIFYSRTLESGAAIGQDLSAFLKQWLVEHIMVEDRKFKDFVAYVGKEEECASLSGYLR